MPLAARSQGIRAGTGPGSPFGLPLMGPAEIAELYTGVQMPDPITFVIGEKWLNRPNLYPRQATLLKIIFLRDDLFTEYDHQVIAEWIKDFDTDANPNGISPDIYERIAWLKAHGYKWFREVMLAIGRRGGKGYISALCYAYVLWSYMSKGDPQEYYGIDPAKQLVCLVFAGKKEQAVKNLWGDLNGVIVNAPCFERYISRQQAEAISVFAPRDLLRRYQNAIRGVVSTKDQASFALLPKESTTLAGRGPASFALGFDEMAHVVKSVAKNEACLDPKSRVLGADLSWRPIGDLQPGDLLVGIDEEVEEGSQRKLRETKVVAITRNRQRPYKLIFDDGSHIICSGNHRWLHHNLARWGETRRLRVGSRVRAFVDPWEPDDTRDGGYLAGFFDGEGFILGTGRPRGETVKKKSYGLGFSQNPGPVLDHVKGLMEVRGYEFRESQGPHGCHQVYLKGMAESLRFLGEIRPGRLLENNRHVWEGKAPHGRYKTIVKIERLPEQELVDIQTTTGTFMAEGLVSHNSEVYEAATPSLDQFGKDGFLIAPSSTWAKTGKFYELAMQALERENDAPVYPEKILIQLPSWGPYEDWERAGDLPVFPDGFDGDLREYEAKPPVYFRQLRGAIQVYDEQMAKIERANPDTFAVERRSHWQAALDAYLNPKMVENIFGFWSDRPELYGPPVIERKSQGLLVTSYMAHGDPSNVNCRFGFAVAHEELAPELNADGTVKLDKRGQPIMVAHAVFDLIHHWDPADYPNNIIDYDEVTDWIWSNVVLKFHPEELTFDQYNSPATVQKLQKKVRAAQLPKFVNVFEVPATAPLNWSRYETFKAAINMGLVHAPEYPEAEAELTFLTKPEGVNRVDHQTTGPVQTKDIADCLVQCTYRLLGEQMNNFLNKDLRNLRPAGGLMGGVDPLARMSADNISPQEALSGFHRSRGAGRPGQEMPARMPRGMRHHRY